MSICFTVVTIIFRPSIMSDRDSITGLTEQIRPVAVLASLVAGNIVLVVMAYWKLLPSLRDRSPTGAAWSIGSPKQILAGGGLGLLIALGFVALLNVNALRPTDFEPGPITRMAMTPGLPQTVWLVMAVILAPPMEELLFRGVVYGGYRRSFGATWAAVVTTAIFCALHVTEVIHFPFAIVSIAALAGTALWMRLRSQAIGPAIAVHFCYNSVLAVVHLTAGP